MNKDGRLWLIAALLIASAAFLLAGPLGDWVGNQFRSPRPPITKLVTENPTKLPTLRLKREVLKPPTTTETEEPALPSPKTTGRTGTLSNNEIEETIQQRQPMFQHCWTQRLRESPGLSGQVLLQFEITPRGKVQDVKSVESTIHDEIMTRCLISVLERVPFRAFDGGPITLTFPLSFE